MKRNEQVNTKPDNTISGLGEKCLLGVTTEADVCLDWGLAKSTKWLLVKPAYALEAMQANKGDELFSSVVDNEQGRVLTLNAWDRYSNCTHTEIEIDEGGSIIAKQIVTNGTCEYVGPERIFQGDRKSDSLKFKEVRSVINKIRLLQQQAE